MKKIAMAGMVAAATLLSGCMGPYSGGLIYNNYNQPLSVRDNDHRLPIERLRLPRHTGD